MDSALAIKDVSCWEHMRSREALTEGVCATAQHMANAWKSIIENWDTGSKEEDEDEEPKVDAPTPAPAPECVLPEPEVAPPPPP